MRLRLTIIFIACAFAVTARGGDADKLKWDTSSLRVVYDPGRAFYCYAPSVFIDDNGVEHFYACRNREPKVTRDHIYYFTRKAAKILEPAIALGPGADGTWDSYHICDPSVIAGSFRFENVAYSFAMFYLGNNVNAACDNQIGVAFANAPSGPWHRYLQPIVAYKPTGTWGAGQPSAINIDHAGRVLLFYTAEPGATAYLRELDLSDMSKPTIGEAIIIQNEGLKGTDGRPDYLNDFDVVLDESHDRFIAVREQHPAPASEPRFIGAAVDIVTIPTGDLKAGHGQWQSMGSVSPQLTGLARNHNAGFVRSRWGTMIDPKLLRVIFSSSDEEPKLNGVFAPWTYVLHEIDGALSD